MRMTTVPQGWFSRLFGSSGGGSSATGRATLRHRRGASAPRPHLPLSGRPPLESAEPVPAPGPRLSPVRSWVYQLQSIDPKVIAACPADVIVIDSSADGDPATAFTPADLALMKSRGEGRPPRRVISYMSIGEAEERRFYWKPEWVAGKKRSPKAPSWLYALNDQGWEGNWKVRFWYPDWQRIIFGTPVSFLDRIIDQGFDGVYLDIVDAYDFWLDDARGAQRRPTAAEEMVSFVSRIADHARRVRGQPEFAVIPQNGEGLLVFPRYCAAISALGKEDILYEQIGQANMKPRVKARPETGDNGIEAIAGHLRIAIANRIPIVAVEYLLDWPEDRRKIAATVERMRQMGLVPHIARRDLEQLAEAIEPQVPVIPVA